MLWSLANSHIRRLYWLSVFFFTKMALWPSFNIRGLSNVASHMNIYEVREGVNPHKLMTRVPRHANLANSCANEILAHLIWNTLEQTKCSIIQVRTNIIKQHTHPPSFVHWCRANCFPQLTWVHLQLDVRNAVFISRSIPTPSNMPQPPCHALVLRYHILQELDTQQSMISYYETPGSFA